MATPIKRYFFLDYENLQRIRFRKLEKVCDKVFIFVSAEEERIPITLVQQIQKLGKNAKWIVANAPQGQALDLHISFLMGRLHEKISKEIEFAVLSDKADYDSLIAQINAEGRSCLRVKRPEVEATAKGETSADSIFQSFEPATKPESMPDNVIFDEEETEEIARDTVRWLIRSGNRPVALASLKSYILMQHKDDLNEKNIDKVIGSMIEHDEIRVNQGEVEYNF